MRLGICCGVSVFQVLASAIKMMSPKYLPIVLQDSAPGAPELCALCYSI